MKPVPPIFIAFVLDFPGICTQKILHYLSCVGGQLQLCQNQNRNIKRIIKCLCFPIWLCPMHLQTLWKAPSMKLTCFVTLWQTLAGISHSPGFLLLNQSNPPFLFPTSDFLREAYWFCPRNDTNLFSSVEDVSTVMTKEIWGKIEWN